MPTPTDGPWERAISLATLGLARSPGPIVDLLPHEACSLPPGPREQTVLRSAATTLLWRLAGERSGAATAPAETVAPAAPRQLIPETAARRLARLVTEGPRELTDEWFALAARSGRVLAPHWVPTVFEAIAPDARNAYAAVFGARLVWLAAHDPRWRVEGAGRTPTDEDWAVGTLPERTALLQRMRQTDPARARSWLEGTWATEPPESREHLIAILRTNLSSEDEPFLEAALDDKRKAVRQCAADLLLRLPQSMCTRRALGRLESMFVLEPRGTGLLGRFASRKLRIELPTALDKSALRDGIEAKPPAARKIGERAWWLMQMIATVPPAGWSERFSCTASELIAAADATDYPDELYGAFTAACVRRPDHPWVQALSAAWRARLGRAETRATAIDSISRLLVALPAAAQESLLLDQIEALRDPEVMDVAVELLLRFDRFWSPALTAKALDVLDRCVRGAASQVTLPRTTLDSWARRADPQTAAMAIGRLLERIAADSPWRNTLERVRDFIDFRIDMHKELLT